MPEALSIRFCNGVIELGLVSLIIFTPLAFGTVQVWSITVVHLITLAMLATWLIKMNSLGKFKLMKVTVQNLVGRLSFLSESKVELYR